MIESVSVPEIGFEILIFIENRQEAGAGESNNVKLLFFSKFLYALN